MNFKYLFVSLVIIIFPVPVWFDVWRDFNDARIQSKIEENLTAKLPTSISELISNATVVCILPSYSRPDSIKSFLSSEQMIYLNHRINSFVGIGDHVWWLLSLKRDESIQAYRMGGFSRPAFKSGKCLSQQDSVISFSEKRGYSFFNFSKGE